MSRENVVRNEQGEILKAGGVVVDSGKVLLVTGLHGTIWSFPKGHVEPGETLEECALREVREETGYTAEITKRLVDLVYTNKETGDQIRVAMFKMKPVKYVELVEKDIRVQWFPIQEAKESLSYHKPYELLVELED